MSTGTGVASEQFVIFKLGEESYGVDIGSVREIITMRPITRVPKAPSYVEGVINLRGRVIPVIDLRFRLGLESAEARHSARIVVVEVQSNTVGMIVDGVSEVLRISPEDIQVVPSSIVSGVDSAFLMGVAKLENRLVILLSLEEVLEKDDRRLEGDWMPSEAQPECVAEVIDAG